MREEERMGEEEEGKGMRGEEAGLLTGEKDEAEGGLMRGEAPAGGAVGRSGDAVLMESVGGGG